MQQGGYPIETESWWATARILLTTGVTLPTITVTDKVPPQRLRDDRQTASARIHSAEKRECTGAVQHCASRYSRAAREIDRLRVLLDPKVIEQVHAGVDVHRKPLREYVVQTLPSAIRSAVWSSHSLSALCDEAKLRLQAVRTACPADLLNLLTADATFREPHLQRNLDPVLILECQVERTVAQRAE